MIKIKFKKLYNRLFLNNIRKAIEDYNMICPKDKIAIGLSGGKDSSFLLFCLKLIQCTYIKDFELMAIHIDLGFEPESNLYPLQKYCMQNNITLIIEKTDIADVVFKKCKEKKPCYLCSKLRRGALSRVAAKYKINKIALGHHSDDAIETLFMNVLKVGKLGTFHPNIYNPKKDMNIIRPMIYIQESLIESLVHRWNLPVIHNNCPMTKKTTREDMKRLLRKLETIYPDAQKKILTALGNIDEGNLWSSTTHTK